MPQTAELSHHVVSNPTLAYVTYASPTSEEPSWDDGLNVLATQREYLERRPGLVGVETSAAGLTTFTSIQRVFTWRRWAGAFFIMLNDVTATQSKVYKLQVGTDTAFVLIHTSAVAVPFDFQVANNSLFFGNGNDMKKWDTLAVTAWGISATTATVAATGPRSTGTGTDSLTGGSAWTNPGNITASDNSYATATNTTNYLQATNFGFTLTANQTLVGIKVEIEGHGNSTPNPSEATSGVRSIQMLLGGVAVGSDHATFQQDSNNTPDYSLPDITDAYVAVGNSADLWGRSSWAYTDINATSFGVQVQFYKFTQLGGVTQTHSGDHIRITVYTTGGITPTVAMSGTGITATSGFKYVQCFENLGTAHLSSPSNESASTGAFVNQQVNVGTTASTDTQVTGQRIFRTTDGGGVAYFGITGNPFANTTGNKTDTTLDTALSSRTAPTSGFNDPPPNSYGFAYWANRIWMHTGNKVWFTGWEEISSGVPEECVPSGEAGNFWAFDSEVTGVATVADGVLVFTASAIWKVLGDSLDTFRRVIVAQGLGCRNRATICSFGKFVGWLDVGNSVWITDGESVTDIGTDILPDLDGINHEQASMCFFNSKTFQWLCLLDGAAARLRIYDGRRRVWQVPWSIGGRSIWAGETAAGTTELIIGHSTGKCLKLSASTFTDNGTAYSCSLRSNLFAICQPNRPDTLGALHHIGLETNAFEPSAVKFLTDEDADTGTFTDITATVRNAELRTQGTDLKDRWYPVSGITSKAARRIAMSFTWPADANHWKMFSYDLAYQKVGGRD